jgi:hypothetical protein
MNDFVYFVHSRNTSTLIFKARGMNNIASSSPVIGYFMSSTIVHRISENLLGLIH